MTIVSAFWDQHGDAVIMSCILFAAFGILLLAHDRKAQQQVRRIRARYVKRLEQHADEAIAAVDEPIPYPPVWTTGALPEDVVDHEFGRLMHRGFIAGGE